MQTAPFVETITKPESQKAVIALMDPKIRMAELDSDVPYIRITEEDVVVVIEFPNFNCLDRFIRKVAAL